HDCCRICVRRRPAGHSSASTPTANQERMSRPLLSEQPVQRGAPRLVQFRRWRADATPGGTPRLFEAHHGRAECRQALREQFKIKSANTAAGAMAKHQHRARLLSKIDKEPGGA